MPYDPHPEAPPAATLKILRDKYPGRRAYAQKVSGNTLVRDLGLGVYLFVTQRGVPGGAATEGRSNDALPDERQWFR